MNEKQTNTTKPAPVASPVVDETTVRPTKKQRELLTFIDTFIKEHGYSPSYREVMVGLQYTSVATVALHVGNLIKRGHIRKRDRSARSLEVVASPDSAAPVTVPTNQVAPNDEKWLVEKVEYMFAQLEAQSEVQPSAIDELHVLLGALRILGLEGAAQSFVPRLQALKGHVATPPAPAK